MLDENSFRFLDHEHSLPDTGGWNEQKLGKLWLYNLHYFDDLNGQEADTRFLWHHALINRWIKENPPCAGNGWEPYPTSLRIVNWIKWLLAGNTPVPGMLSSLVVQVDWLSKRIEWHLLGNHLFVNAKALVFAGCFLDGGEAASWLRAGISILKKEIPEQILPDGAQFERSTMYHALAVEDMLDLLNILRFLISSPDVSPNQHSNPIMSTRIAIEQRLPSMLRWMNVMRHPDGGIGLFNDAAFGIAPSCEELISYAARLGIKPARIENNTSITLQDSGYVCLSNSIAYILFDVAPIGPDYLPGHAHADTLSLEMSLFGQRVFVNSGTSEYGISDERHRQRSTAAHNTLEINGENSSEVWSGFRVARRAYPYNQSFETQGDMQCASAWHSGYKRLSPPVAVGRKITLRRNLLEIEDLIEGQCKYAIARFYCHPDIVAKIVSEGLILLKLKEGQTVSLTVEGGEKVTVESSTWHPKFGVIEKNQCIVITLLTRKLITRLEWSPS